MILHCCLLYLLHNNSPMSHSVMHCIYHMISFSKLKVVQLHAYIDRFIQRPFQTENLSSHKCEIKINLLDDENKS